LGASVQARPTGASRFSLRASGHPLEWCTADYDTAKTQLEMGDFYVYYSENKDGKNKTPRAALRMQGNSIAELRGIADNQNLDPFMGDVVDAKLKEFGKEGELYTKRANDMDKFNDIWERSESGHNLSSSDLRFLYQIDAPIEGFGYQRDPRIKELLSGRDAKEDLSAVLDVPKEQISTTKEEALSGGIKYHYGSLDLYRLTSAEGLVLPESVGGSLSLRSLTSADDLTLPKSIGGDLNLVSLTSAEGLVLPESIGGGLYLRSLTSAEGLTLPESIGGDLNLDSLTLAEKEKLREEYPNFNIV